MIAAFLRAFCWPFPPVARTCRWQLLMGITAPFFNFFFSPAWHCYSFFGPWPICCRVRFFLPLWDEWVCSVVECKGLLRCKVLQHLGSEPCKTWCGLFLRAVIPWAEFWVCPFQKCPFWSLFQPWRWCTCEASDQLRAQKPTPHPALPVLHQPIGLAWNEHEMDKTKNSAPGVMCLYCFRSKVWRMLPALYSRIARAMK